MSVHAVRLAFAASVVGLALAGVATAQSAAPTSAPATVPRMADGSPDFSGTYNNRLGFPPRPSLKGKYLEQMTEFQKATAQGRPIQDPGATCANIGNGSVLMYNPYAMEIFQTPKLMLMLFEGGDGIRHIYLDGRGHPSDLKPTAAGHGVGHFEGDTLVIDTVGYAQTRMSPMGEVLSDKVHTVDRLSFGRGEVIDDYTIDDPDGLSAPWRITYHLIAKPGQQMLQWDCEENNRNRPDENGVTGVQGVVK